MVILFFLLFFSIKQFLGAVYAYYYYYQVMDKTSVSSNQVTRSHFKTVSRVGCRIPMMPSIKWINFNVIGSEAKHLQAEVCGLTFFPFRGHRCEIVWVPYPINLALYLNTT